MLPKKSEIDAGVAMAVAVLYMDGWLEFSEVWIYQSARLVQDEGPI